MPDTRVRIADPADLTPAEVRLAGQLAELEPDQFDLAVYRLVTGSATDELQHALYSPELAEETMRAFGRLQAAAQAEASNAPKGTARRAAYVAHVNAIGELRRELRPIVNLAVADAARKGPRHHAQRILGQVRYAELKEIMTDLDAGMTEREAAAAHRARLGARGETGLAVMTRDE